MVHSWSGPAQPSSGRLPHAFTTPGSSSFVEFLAGHAPELLPGNRPLPAGEVHAPHGTTIVALTFDGGVVVAGRRTSPAYAPAFVDAVKAQTGTRYVHPDNK